MNGAQANSNQTKNRVSWQICIPLLQTKKKGRDFLIGRDERKESGVEMAMKPITVVDARMGRGKSSAAIRYMNANKGTKRFLYITPYLNEVDRICERCDFDQSESDYQSKSAELKVHIKDGRNIAATHSLFYLMDKEAVELVRDNHYSLIIDESIRVIERLNVTEKDFELIVTQLADEEEGGILQWKDGSYTGRFYDYKEMADVGALYKIDSALLNIMNPLMLKAFDEVFMLTYLFDGQYQKAYLEYFGLPYRVVGVEKDDCGYYFSDAPDSPTAIDYRSLIHIVDSDEMNRTGNGKYALSKNWFARRGYNHADIRALRYNMKKFFQGVPGGSSSTRMWTSFKDDMVKLTDVKTGRFRNNFLQVSARATNEFRNRTDIAYMVNRFADPNLIKFFSAKGIGIDTDAFALTEMLQWIWRSAIRDDKPINLYIPSRRMRELLINWMDTTSQGGTMIE